MTAPQSLSEFLDRVGRRALAQALGVALLFTVAAWYFGADVWHAILLGGVITTLARIGLGAAARLEVGEIDWRESSPSTRAGSRNDIVQLSDSLQGRYGRVGDGAMWRVQQLARRRLALHQLDLADPADRPRIEQLIGARDYRLLVRRHRRPPSLRSLLRCLDALDALATSTRTTPASR